MEESDLKAIFSLNKKCGSTDFSEVVKASCGYDVIPIDANNNDDADLVKHLTFALNNFLELTQKSGQRYHGDRINEVGKKIENQIADEIKKMPLEISKLGSSGYPDFEIRQSSRIAYLELKTTGNKNKSKTHHRMFYYSSGKKIKSDARHLLIQIQMEEESNKYWKVLEWELRDLSDLKVRLKTEFNSNFQGVGMTRLLSSSKQEAAAKQKRGRRTKVKSQDSVSTPQEQQTFNV